MNDCKDRWNTVRLEVEDGVAWITLCYIMTGQTFTGFEAADMGLVNRSVPRAQLRDEVSRLAVVLRQINPMVLSQAKHGFKRCRELTWEQNEDYLYAKVDQGSFRRQSSIRISRITKRK